MVKRLPPSVTSGPPEASIFSRIGVGIFVLLLCTPLLLFGGMLWDMNRMKVEKEESVTLQESLIDSIDMLVHPSKFNPASEVDLEALRGTDEWLEVSTEHEQTMQNLLKDNSENNPHVPPPPRSKKRF
jgi:Arc/MetJ-type ribon-helix-helix transcriptional regulator